MCGQSDADDHDKYIQKIPHERCIHAYQFDANCKPNGHSFGVGEQIRDIWVHHFHNRIFLTLTHTNEMQIWSYTKRMFNWKKTKINSHLLGRELYRINSYSMREKG